MTPSPVLEIRGVSKDFHGLRPLRIDALSLDPAEQCAVVGLDAPTAEVFVNVITGATIPDHGEVRLFGKSTASIDSSAEWLSVIDQLGIVSSRAVLLDGMSVIQNLAMPFTLDLDPVAEAVQDRVAALAAEMGIEDGLWRRPVGELDPMNRARVRLGRALALNPALVILEHVNATVPDSAVESLADMARSIFRARGCATVVLTADEKFAARVASRVLWLDPVTGRLAAKPRRRGWW